MKAGRIASSFVLLAVGAAAEPSVKAQPEPVAIGSRLELFVDGHLIESLEGTRLKLHPPRPAERVLFFDREWEGGNSGYVTVFRDGGRYRMYYRGASSTGYAVPSLSKPGETPVPKHPQVACYAESPDGITWSRPSLGLFEFHGSNDNNIVRTGSGGHNFSPFKDTNPGAVPEQRYKAVGSGQTDGKPVLLGFVSPDGIRWKRLREEPLLTDGKFDSLNVAFRDSVRSRYVAFYRDFRHGVRTIKHATSDNFLDWTPGQWGDFGDTPPEHLYTNGTVAYFRAPHLFLALPRRFLPWRQLYPDAPVPGASDGVFMSSRDGVHWDRRFLESFIRPGRDPRNWPQRTNTPARGIVPTAEDEISLYVERHRSSPTNHLQRLVLRTDGFVSVHAGYSGGEMITKPLLFEGDNLVLNFATSAAGSIRIEILDAHGRPVPGFALEESPLIWGDKIEHVVQWKRTHPKATSEKPLAHLAGTPVRLRLVMKDADLYSLRFR